jgi:hypothetical protein
MQLIESGNIARDIGLLDSRRFNANLYQKSGVFILRGAIPSSIVASWQLAWRAFKDKRLAQGRQVNPFNPVVVNEALPPALAEIHRCEHLLDVGQLIYPDLALYMQRMLVKDEKSRAPVFLHHDFGYDTGWPEKTSMFVPLTRMDESNGGLACYPGTQKFGYLGDVGEFDRAILGADWPRLCPAMEPGDVLLVHECTWHESAEHKTGPDRVMAQITYQPASDPSSTALLRGSWRTDVRLGDIEPGLFFKRSRQTRLRELQRLADRGTSIPEQS